MLTWTLMQHYGAPTRLLDWTDSPLIALYHAVETNWQKDGVLFAINNMAIERKSTSIHGQFRYNTLWDHDYRDTIVSLIPIINTKRSFHQQGIFTISSNPLESHDNLIKALNIDKSNLLVLTIRSHITIVPWS